MQILSARAKEIAKQSGSANLAPRSRLVVKCPALENTVYMTPGNVRANSVRSPIVICTNVTCRHEAIVNVDSQGDAAFVPALGRPMRCQQCGQRGADVRPNWNEKNAQAPITCLGN